MCGERPGEDSLEPAAQAGARLRRALPYRQEHLEHDGGVDRLELEAAELGAGERESVAPAARILELLNGVGLHELSGGLGERGRADRLEASCLLAVLFELERIEAVEDRLLGLPSSSPSLGQVYRIERAEAELVRLAGDHIAQDPRGGAARADKEHQAVAVTMPARDLRERRQL